MTKYALILNGVVDTIAFQPEDGFVDVPDDVFGGFTANPGGTFTAPGEVRPLDEIKASLKASIDTAAEIERRKYITAGSGQAMTYMQKADEAARYLAAVEPIAVDYPLLSAEIGITAPTIREVAVTVNAAYTQWQQIGAAIEAARLGTKVAIEAAMTAEEAREAADAIAWP